MLTVRAMMQSPNALTALDSPVEAIDIPSGERDYGRPDLLRNALSRGKIALVTGIHARKTYRFVEADIISLLGGNNANVSYFGTY